MFQGIWIAGNIGMFVYGYLKYKNGKEWFYLRLMIGVSYRQCYITGCSIVLNNMFTMFP